jgi:dienelactone hydrolase
MVEPQKDPLSAHQAKNRELAVQFWYPTRQKDGQIAPDMFPFRDWSPFIKSPFFALVASHLAFVRTHSEIEAPLSKKIAHYPVVIFSHGLMGWRGQNTDQMEWLASHGFIVVAPDHTYDAAFSVFPDGHVVTSQLLAGKESSDAATLKEVDLEERLKDLNFLLDELPKLNAKDPRGRFTDKLDVKNVGVLGHSMGGTAAISLSQHSNLKAAIALDGGPAEFISPLCPLMVLQAERYGDPLEIRRLYATTNAFPIYNIKVNRAGHTNFTDLPLITRLHWVLGMSGNINQFDAERVINTYALYFFSKYLKGIEEDFSLYKFEGVKLTKWLPPRKPDTIKTPKSESPSSAPAEGARK